MKTYLLALSIVFITVGTLVAQPKPKAKTKEAAPTQKEMEALMKEAQQEMDNLDPETKRMMDSMGIKVPSFNTVPQVTDAQLQEAYDNDNRIVPKKDNIRIASISKTPLTNTSMPGFLSATHGKVVMQLKPASKVKGEEIYRLIKTQYNSATAAGNTAAGLWMMGKPELALYVMGMACIDSPTSANNLNNYASMLSMSGAEQLSLPILNYVNKRFPKNSTVLNNIGQAWFGLGDIDKANAYLDSTIRIYAFHAQANYTKSFIEESKGNKTAAIAAVKRSIKKSYNQEKENRLKKLGYNLTSDDLNWNRPMPQDALGLEKFKWPEYPMNVAESETLEKAWNIFKEVCKNEIAALKIQEKKNEQEAVAANQKRIQSLLQAGQKGLRVDPLPPLAPKAMIKLKYLIDGKDGHLAVTYQKKTEALAKAYLEVTTHEEKLSTQLEAIKNKYEDQFGEGKPNPFAAVCSDENSASNNFLLASNTGLQRAFTDYADFLRRKLNDETYYYQYTMWPEDFEVAKVHAKLAWLTTIYGQKVMFRNQSSSCQEKQTIKKDEPFKLAAFDDVHCMYHSELSTPVGTITTDCSRMTTKLDLKFIKLGLKQDMDKATFGDQFMNCSVEVGASASLGSDKLGPLKAEASVGGSLAMEFDRTGLKDVVVKGEAGVSAGTDIIEGGSQSGVGVSDLQIEAGVKGQISLISGVSSVGGTGVLAGK